MLFEFIKIDYQFLETGLETHTQIFLRNQFLKFISRN
jgi:hypothetical protein